MSYRVLLNTQRKFELVDTRDEVDMSRFIGYTTSTWKKLVTAGQRRWNSSSATLHNGSTYILTYPDNSIQVVNPGKGDYIKPGFTRISQGLEHLFMGHDGDRCANRARIVPLGDHKLLNTTLNVIQRQFCVYRGQPNKQYLPGWTIFTNTERSYYCYMTRDDDGVGLKCRTVGDNATIHQTMCKEIFEGSTSLRLRARGATTVMIGTDALTPGDDGIWTWEGEAIAGDTMITVGIGSEHYVTGVNFLND